MSKYRIPNEAEHRSDGTTVLFLKRQNGETLECVLDSQDYPKVQPFRWYAHKMPYTTHVKAWVHGKKITMHRFLMPGSVVAHLDYDGLNNRRNNLAVMTRAESNRRRRKIGQWTSKYKGVSRSAGSNLFRATITHNDKTFHLGYFDCEEDAAAKYNAQALDKFGALAELNQLPN